MTEIEETVKRIAAHPGVIGIIIINTDGIPIRTTMDAATTVKYTGLIHQFVNKARSTVKDFDPLNEVTFVRLRTHNYEIMVAPVTAKIRNLKDYHYRMANNLSPQPSGVDVANTLKYFSQTLLSVLKDVPLIPQESSAPRQRDSLRLSVFPNLNYAGLYEAVISMISVVHSVQHGQHALGQSILSVLGCLVPFLEYEMLDMLPLSVANTLNIFPITLQDDIIQLLCTNLLPTTLGYEGMNKNPTYATDSTAAIIMMVLQYVENPAYHSQMIECIMSMKLNVCKDLLSVIAFGPPAARAPAVHHLFHYWPQLNPSLSDTRIQRYDYTAWEPMNCQRESCPNQGNAKSVKMCLDPAISIECGDRPPPIFICADCVDLCRRDHIRFLHDVLKPLESVAIKCENKNCHSVHNTAVCTCFSLECTSLNRFKPMRYCATCHSLKHGADKPTSTGGGGGGSAPAEEEHIYHETLPDMWNCSPALQGFLVEAIVSLLKEAQPLEEKRTVEMGEERHRHAHYEEDEDEEGDGEEERKLLSRYGIWLLVELAKPKPADIPIDVLGRLIAMLFQWFDATAYLPDDNVGNALERLKPQYVCRWLTDVSKTHFEVVLSCLLPHPVEYARVGGHWDTLSSRTSQIKEGLNRLCCLIPYDIINFEVWDYAIPFWLEAIRTEVPEEERQELKVLLRKVFDTDMSPLPFNVEKMYHFVMERFDNTTALVQEQNLAWLQILSTLEILVPLNLLVDMFQMGVTSLACPARLSDVAGPDLQASAPPNVPLDDLPMGSPLSPPPQPPPNPTPKDHSPRAFSFDFMDAEGDEAGESIKNVTCFVMMLDLVLVQAELQESACLHKGLYNEQNKEIQALATRILTTSWEGNHTCHGDTDDEDDDDEDAQPQMVECVKCEVAAQLLELISNVIEYIAPKEAIKLPAKDLPKVDDHHPRRPPHPQGGQRGAPYHPATATSKATTTTTTTSSSLPPRRQSWHGTKTNPSSSAAAAAAASTAAAANTTTSSSYLNPAHSGNTLHPNSPVSDPSPTTSTTAAVSPMSFDTVQEALDWMARGSSSLGEGDEEEELEFDTSVLPPHAQLLHNVLKCIDEMWDADGLYFLLRSVKLLCLHCECLTHVVRENDEYVKYALKKLMLPNMWKLLQAEHSQLGTICVPLILYCLTLPTGPDVFWHMVEDDYNNEDWHARFSAVEKVTMLARLIEPETIQHNQQIMTSLAHAFCCLIGSVNDINSAVVQRAVIYLQTIKRSAIKCIIHCLEYQFDSVIKDRSMILQKMYLLSVVLKDEDHCIFTWEFFLNRFDTLCLEAQLDLESTGDIASLQDLQSTDRHSDSFLRKINRARFALARTDSIRSVSYSVYAKVPYRRAASVPMHLLTKTLPQMTHIKENSPPESASPEAKEDNMNELKTFLEHLNDLAEEKDKSPYTRQQSAPQFRSRGSRFGLGMFSNYMFPGGHLREFTDEESNFAALLQRAMDLEGVDRETIHQLVSLLMKFMVYVNQDKVNEDRNMSRAQSIVLRHLNVLLGYNQTEKAFSVPPYKLRYSAVFNAYISLLPMVLDKNFELGNIILPVSMALLQYCPSPQRYASDYQPPNYTLWYLDSHTRQAWLKALLVILYKYQYNTSPACSIIQTLVRLSINTVAAQIHRCKAQDEAFGPASPIVPRPRDLSTVSGGDLGDILETETPPASPGIALSPITIDMTSPNTTVHYRISDSVKTEETDVDSLSPTSKVTSPISRFSPPPAGPVPPPPPHPSSLLQRPSSPGVPMRALPTLSGPNSPTSDSAVAAITSAHRSADQPRRIAEYNRSSWYDEDEEAALSEAGKGNAAGEAARSLEQSVEQFMMEQVKGNKAMSPKAVDEKIAEQLLAFESHGKNSGPPVPEEKAPLEKSQSMDTAWKPTGHVTQHVTQHLPGHLSAHLPAGHTPGHLPGFEKKFEPVGKTAPHVLEDVKEAEEEWESPKKSLATKDPCEGAALTVEQGNHTESDLDESPCASPPSEPRRLNIRQRKARKTGLSTVELQKMIPELGDLRMQGATSPTTSRRARRHELMNKSSAHSSTSTGIGSSQGGGGKKSVNLLRMQEQLVVERCPDCHAPLEQYDEETIALAIVCLETFIHREPALAAPLLHDMLQVVARIAASHLYTWQADIPGLHIPGNCVSVARQFLRCTVHQLAPNAILPQLFLTDLDDPEEFLRTLAAALADFSELNSYGALQLLLEGVSDTEITPALLANLAIYLDCIPVETSPATWAPILPLFEAFFRRLPGTMTPGFDIVPLMKIMIAVLKAPGIVAVKGILEPFSKLLSYTVQHCKFKLQQLSDICCLCSRAFSKERDKLYLVRTLIYELVQALKFKTQLTDENLVLLVQFVCLDAGGTVGAMNFVEELATYSFNPHMQSLVSSNAADCMKQHLSECVDFVADIHTISKVKTHAVGTSDNLNEDTLGSHLKAAIAQYVALEFTRGNGRDNRAISRYLPWLYHPPSTLQQGMSLDGTAGDPRSGASSAINRPREFVDCVGHIRLLSWLLLGSLTHLALTGCRGHIVCQPLPLEAGAFLADHIMVIMTGFAEQSKTSVLHMSSLFHAFILCQLWTLYCECFAAQNPDSGTLAVESTNTAHSTIMDFWAHVTPGILQLLSHSKVLSEMVNLHFLSLIEALQECNSMVLNKLFPMWTPILYSYHKQLPGHMQVRLQMCQNWEPREERVENTQVDANTLATWLKRLQFKLGQIEVQSSQATQFYTV